MSARRPVGVYARRNTDRAVGVYARLSKEKGDRRGGGSLAIDRQQSDCYDLRDRTGLNPETVDYPDDGYSAFDPDVVRPAWTQMLDDIRDGKLSAVIAWHADRLTRQPMELEILWDACKRSGTELHVCGAGHVTDVTMLRIQATMAAKSSEDTSRRCARKHEEIATAATGAGFNGGRRRFGYEEGMTEIRESEATIVRDMASRVLAGESLTSIAKTLNDAGISGPYGGAWIGSNVGKLLRRPFLAGLREYRGETYTAEWTPILDRATHEAIVHKLTDPSRRSHKSNARKYLLAGLARCATCGAKLRGKGYTRQPTSDAYTCASGRHCYRQVRPVDAAVEAIIIERLSQLDASGALVDDTAEDDLDQLRELRADLDGRLAASSKAYARGDKSERAHNRDTAAIEEEQDRLDALIASSAHAIAEPERILDGITGDAAEERWDSLPLGRKRAVIELLCSVELLPSPSSRTPFTTDQLIIRDAKTGQEWK